jgi:two-component system LytT family response regulator
MNEIKALIVDDEPKLRTVLQLKLQQYCKGVQVLGTAGNIEGATELIQLHSPDLVFLDISMPGGSGFELLERLEKVDFEIIFVTGYDEYALDALRVSAVDYLLKPVVTEELVQGS